MTVRIEDQFDPESEELAGMTGKEAERFLMALPREEAKRILKDTIRRILAKQAAKPKTPEKTDPFSELITECVREVTRKD